VGGRENGGRGVRIVVDWTRVGVPRESRNDRVQCIVHRDVCYSIEACLDERRQRSSWWNEGRRCSNALRIAGDNRRESSTMMPLLLLKDFSSASCNRGASAR
jgi:hypothetical protein